MRSGEKTPKAALQQGRRSFLSTLGAGMCGFFLSPGKAFPGGSQAPSPFLPEYERELKEIVIVYDQVSLPHLFDEVLDILSCLPKGILLHVLCSSKREKEARRRFSRFDRGKVRILVSEKKLWGDWGRDIFHVSWRKGRTTLLVPYNKSSLTRGEITRGYEIVVKLWGREREVIQVPLCFEGGNLAYDRIHGEKVLFVGNSAILESISFYKLWFGKNLSVRDCLSLFKRFFNVERVIPLGRRKEGRLLPQSEYFFHLDLAFSLPSKGTAALERFEIPKEPAPLKEELKEEILFEAECNGERPPEGPRLEGETARRFKAEVAQLREGREELAAIRKTLRELGYRTCDLKTDWRRVRRYQSYANILVGKDRLIMPVFPRPFPRRARKKRTERGRNIVEVRRPPHPREYRLSGWNRDNYLLYTTLHSNVRIVRDAFYLAGGNIHCVIGSIG